MRRRGNKIIITMFIFMLVIFSLLIVNIFSASILNTHLRSQVDINQYSNSSESKTSIKSKRGNIYDSTQTIIAEDITSYNIIAYLDESRVGAGNKPHFISDTVQTAQLLEEALGGEASFYQEMMDSGKESKKYQTEFGSRGRNLDLKTKKLIEESELPGLEFTTTSKRHYPLGQFSSQLIGFSDLDEENQNQVGKMGIELKYNDILSGTDGSSISTVTEKGFKLPNMSSTIKEAENGEDIYLTLNKNVQAQLEDSLSESMTISNTDKAWGMVMEISTGKIIAIGQAPSFNPETREGIVYSFYPTDFVFEPGSTMKAITYAAAIEEGLDVNKTFNSKRIHVAYDKDGKAYRVSENDNFADYFSNANNKEWGVLSYAQGFSISSNVGIVELFINEISSSKFEEYMDAFRFFQPTILDNFEGASGVKQFKYSNEKITNGFGQGSTTTMMHMAQAFGAILNDGKMMQPYVVDQIVNSNDEVTYKGEPEVIATPISPETSKVMKELMYGVVHDDLSTGRNYFIDEIDVIAKTGTAQLVIDGEYSNERFISSVGSAFPADDPKYLVFYAYESQVVDSAYFTAAKPINDLVLKVADEYNLIDSSSLNQKPKEQEEIIVSDMPSLINHSLKYAKEKLDGSGIDLIIIGEGDNIINQYPLANQRIISKQRIILYTGEGKITMPNMVGWSRKEVVAFWEASGASFIIEGFGNVYNQDVPKGTIIDSDSEVKVYLR